MGSRASIGSDDGEDFYAPVAKILQCEEEAKVLVPFTYLPQGMKKRSMVTATSGYRCSERRRGKGEGKKG